MLKPMAEFAVDGDGTLVDARVPTGNGTQQDVGELADRTGEVVAAHHRPLEDGDGNRELRLLSIETEHLGKHSKQQGVGGYLQRVGSGLECRPSFGTQGNALPLEVDAHPCRAPTARELWRGGHGMQACCPIIEGCCGYLLRPQLVAVIAERQPVS